MVKEGFFKLSYQILIFEIPKYLELNDYLNYISTCKFLKNNYKHSSIWKRLLNKKYTEEEILFAQNENSSYDKYKKLVTQTLRYDECEVAHGNTHWRKNEDELYLIGVWWFQILGKFKYVPDGCYIPEFKIKFSKRRMGLNHLKFKAKVIEVEPIEKEKDDTEKQEQEQSTQSSTSSNSNSVIEKVIMKTKYQINNDIVCLYANDDDQWCIIEGGEIKVDRSPIDPKRTKVVVHLEIRDVDGYYKEGFSFKGMRLRRVDKEDNN